MMKNICQGCNKVSNINFKFLGFTRNFNYLYNIGVKKSFGAYRGNPALSREFENDRAEYKKLRKEANKQHTNDFWTEQTKIENEFLENFEKIQKEKKVRDDAKLRTSMIKSSFQIYSQIVNFKFILY